MKVIDKLLRHAPMSVKLAGVGAAVAAGVAGCGHDNSPNGPGEGDSSGSVDPYSSAQVFDSSSSGELVYSSSSGTVHYDPSSSSFTFSSSQSSSSIRASSSSVANLSSSIAASSSSSSNPSSSTNPSSSSNVLPSSSSAIIWEWLNNIRNPDLTISEIFNEQIGSSLGCTVPAGQQPQSKFSDSNEAELLKNFGSYGGCLISVYNTYNGKYYAISNVPTTSDDGQTIVYKDSNVRIGTIFKGILECMAYIGSSGCRQDRIECDGTNGTANNPENSITLVRNAGAGDLDLIPQAFLFNLCSR